MSDVERRYHESWLGMVQPIEGLVFSVPVLEDASVMERTAPEVQEKLREHLAGDGERVRVRDLRAFFRDVLGFADTDFLAGDDVPSTLSQYFPEGQQRVTPTLVLKTREQGSPAPADAAAAAAASAELLVWQLPDGLSLDKPETTTGTWEYPPHHKMDRLLRAVRMPIGLLTNGEVIRLIYAPHGESTGALTFRLADLASVGGRPILDAFLSLLSAHRFFVAPPDRTLRALLEQSRKRQANVTNELAEQVFAALDLLLHGFEAAAERDGTSALREAMSSDDAGKEGEHVYGGLLTTMLRLVFLLYAEDRDLMPMGNAVFAKHLSVLGLFDELQQDAGVYPDTMNRRFGAWPRLLALFRAVYEGVDADGLQMPGRRGRLFNPDEYPFLEGWAQGGSVPRQGDEARGQMRVPSIDDETIYHVLDKLLLLDGQRLSYRALDVEQIGSVYEALMGYRVQRLVSPAVCLRDSGVWLETERVLGTPANRREALVVEESGLSKGKVSKIADALKGAKLNNDVLEALEPLRKSPKTVPVRQANALVLQPGAERRRTSSHYTPRSLSAPIVEKTLKPLLATMAAKGKEPTADELLELKICDPAMGSGAFLVEACRFLADEVVKAWTRDGMIHGIQGSHGDPVTHARRLVAQRCLYGVDKNPYAVTLAKLSLWLVSFAKGEPFTFVDHALRWGDSLVGLSLEQLRRFHWAEGSAQTDFIVDIVTKDLDEAMYYRHRILNLAQSHGLQNARNKEDLLRDADDAVQNARLLADILVGAFFAHEKDKDREKERLTRLTAAQQWVSRRTAPTAEIVEWQRRMTAITPPFHWPIEFPEVFYSERSDPLGAETTARVAWMDGFVGNPPFLGGKRISTELGDAYADWLGSTEKVSKNTDLCAHFIRRFYRLLGEHGTLGFIASNSVSQGDTRAGGLKHVLAKGGKIYDATSSMIWPGDAGVAVAVVHVACGRVRDHVQTRIDGTVARAINSRLQAKNERNDPSPLSVNVGQCFSGSYVAGQGFVLSGSERADLIRRNPANSARIFPYLGGEELNTSPTQSHDRYVINFGVLSLDEAAQWPDLLSIVRDKVKPDREQTRLTTGMGGHGKKYWWQFMARCDPLYDAIRSLTRCLAISQVSKHCVFAWQPINRVFSHALYVFVFDDGAHFACLQSRLHESWVAELSSSLEERRRYAPSDCFETFPFPQDAALVSGGALDVLGEKLNTDRATLMSARAQGLTTTYNQLKDPACTDERIIALRKLHEEMDRAVLDAYGWKDVGVPPYCPLTEADRQKVDAFEGEVVDRLFVLNAERAKEEELLGLGTKKTAKAADTTVSAANGSDSAPKKKVARKRRSEPKGQSGLF